MRASLLQNNSLPIGEVHELPRHVGHDLQKWSATFLKAPYDIRPLGLLQMKRLSLAFPLALLQISLKEA
jgi:hypothetical protein